MNYNTVKIIDFGENDESIIEITDIMQICNGTELYWREIEPEDGKAFAMESAFQVPPNKVSQAINMLAQIDSVWPSME